MSLDETNETSSASGARKAPNNDIFKILVATDIHLGYGEKDPLIGNFFLARL